MIEKEKLGGVVAPIFTPCNEIEGIDKKKLEKITARLLATDISGLYIGGGTGDGGKLKFSEREYIAEYLVKECQKAKKCAIVHVGQTLQREAVELSEHAMNLGADAVASVPPKAGWNEIVKYYTALAETGAPVVVYYIPGLTGVSAGMNELRRLMDIPGVCGIKVSDWNIFLIKCLKMEYPEKLVYTGLDEMLIPGLSYGADGTIGTWINLLPEFYCKVWELTKAGKRDNLQVLSDAYTEFLALGWKYGILDAFQELCLAKDLALKVFREPGSWVAGSMEESQKTLMLNKIDELTKLALEME